jgi:hypothetical protein
MRPEDRASRDKTFVPGHTTKPADSLAGESARIRFAYFGFGKDHSTSSRSDFHAPDFLKRSDDGLPHGRAVRVFRVVWFPYWSLAIVLAILPAIRLQAMVRIRHRARRGLCPACGYDLRATPGRCPECGAVPAPPVR